MMTELPGLTPDEFLKAKVAQYRRSGFGRSLLEYLGMTPDEYGEWFLTGHVASRVLRTWGRDDCEAAHTEADMYLAALAYGDGSPAAAVAYHVKHCARADGAIVMHHPGESADEVIARLVAAGWTLQEGADRIVGKRVRYVMPPGGTLEL
jgi:hypothetical protein